MSEDGESLYPINAVLGGKLAVFDFDDGRRGLMALKGIRSGEIVFRENLYLWFNREEDDLGIGLSWGLTRNVATKFPDVLPFLQNVLKLRETFRPKLTSSDQKILAQISKESRQPQSVVRTIYSLVCTYNIILSVAIPNGRDLLTGERIAIAQILAFANHSCESNCALLAGNTVESFKSKIVGLRATQDIQAGEEITWNYLSTNSGSFEERQKILKRKFGFFCSCSRCHRERSDSDIDSV